jgi:CheY-like chemotaxis protein
MTHTRSPDPGRARILVVDDDETVLDTVCDALTMLGYIVEPARDAGAALGRFRPGRYQLVVTDLAMPVMNGLELARRLRALEPALPILIFSGAAGAAGSTLASIGVILSPKPDVEGLTRLVERALGPP